MNSDTSAFLAPTEFVDNDSPEIGEFVSRCLDGACGLSETDTAIRLFDAVRDGIRYNPFDIGTVADEYRASRIALKPSNYCVPKAILLAATLRASGIPAAVGFADVRNHLNSPKLTKLMDTDLFIYHGYVAL